MATFDAMIGPQATPWADVLIDTMMTDEHSESDGFTSEWAPGARLDDPDHGGIGHGGVASVSTSSVRRVAP
jgi:hypothetical protein